MKKRLLSFLLCLAILAGQIPAAAFAAEDTPPTEPAAAETTLAEQKDATETQAPAAEEEPKAPEAPAAQQPAPTGEAAPEQTPDRQPTQQPETEGSKGTEAAPTPEEQPVPPPENNVEDQGEAQPEQKPAEGAGPADANSEETEEQPGDSVVTYTITFTDELGTASDETGSEITQAAEGTLVTITAKDRAEEGLLFTAWQAPEGLELADDTEEITTFTMPDSNVELAAEYAPLPEDAEALAEEEEIMLADASPVSGDGTESNPYIVTTFDEFKEAMQQGTKTYIKLGKDINTNDEEKHKYGLTTYDQILVGNTITLDLNGKKLTLNSRQNKVSSYINVTLGNLTVQDSVGGGEIFLNDEYEGGSTLILLLDTATFTLKSGTIRATTKPETSGIDLIQSSGTVNIEGGTLTCTQTNGEIGRLHSEPNHWTSCYALKCFASDNVQTTITGGEFTGFVRIPVKNNGKQNIITNVTFDGSVVLDLADEKNMTWSKPGLTVENAEVKGTLFINGVCYHEKSTDIAIVIGNGWYATLDVNDTNVWVYDYDLFKQTYEAGGNDVSKATFKQGYAPYQLKGGTYRFMNFGSKAEHDIGYRYTQEAFRHILGNGAIKVGNYDDDGYKIYTYSNIGESFKYGDYMAVMNSSWKKISFIPDAWGIKSVTLDGKEINYAKDWNGAVEEMDNSTAHTLKFEWYPLASELVNAGYSYRANFDCYTVGSNTPTTSVPISATAIEYSYTIPAGAAPSVYPFDLQLNLEKNGSSVGIISNQHIVKLVVNGAPVAKDTFVSTVRFDLNKTEVGEPGELSFTATDVNGNTVAINPKVAWDPTLIQEGENKVSFKIPAPTGYTFVDETGKVTTLLLSGEKVIGDVSSDGALNYSFTCQVDHKHKAATVGYNAKYHWDVCSCGQKIMNTSAKHTMGAWKKTKDISGGGEEYTRTCTHTGCGYTETTVDYSGVKHVTSLVLNMKNYPMDGMRPHNFVKNGSETKGSNGEYLLTERDENILYPSFSITSGGDKAKLYAMNPESYTVRADNPDFAMWSLNAKRLAPECDDTSHDHNEKSTFTTGKNYGVRLFLEAKDGYAFYRDFNEASNFKLFTDMNGIEVKTYRVEAWYYKNSEGVDDWITTAPADDSAGASKVRVLFQLTAKNEGDLNITLPELKAGDDLKETWAGFDGAPNLGTGNFVDSCYAKNSKAMQWTGGPSRVIYNNNTTGESVTAQAGQTYTLTIPAVNENVLAHITIKNPEAATKVIENEDGTITVTYTLPAAADNKIVHGAAISVTAPAYGKAPSTTAAITAGDNCTASAVTWNPTDAAFEAKAYTATVTLTPSTDYTFANDAAFTINGHVVAATKNADGSVTLSYTFPALAAPHTHDYTNQPYVYMTPGNHYQECKANDGAYNIEAHDFSAWKDNGDGTHSRHCNVCKKSCETANYTETATHNWQWVVDAPATPNAAGKKHEECTDCGIKQSENTVIPMMTSIKVEQLTVAKPAKDAKAAAATTTDSAYTVTNTQWKAANGTTLAVGEKFKPGTVYTASITLHSNSDAVFSANSTFNAIDGKNAAVAGPLTGDSYAYSIVLTYTFDATEGVAYNITNGANGVWVKGSTDTLSFTADGDFAKFRSVKIDGAELATDKYTAAAGSTVITLKNEYLSTLAAGKHTIAIIYTDGDCSTGFTVHQHTYGAWSSDDTHHWHECTDASCPDKAASRIEKAEHNFEWKIDVPASQASTGTKHEECTVCGKKRNENTVIDKLPGSSSGSHHGSNNSNNNNNTGTEAAAPEAAAPAPAASAPVTTTTSARTGDSSNLIGWLAVLLISGGAAGAWYTVAKKKKEQ